MLEKVRFALVITALLSLAVIIMGYLTNSEAKAPHPDGNFTVLDLSSVYGTMAESMSSIMPYATGILILSIVGIAVTFKNKSC